MTLTLSEAIREDRLEDFIVQQNVAETRAISKAEVGALARQDIRSAKSEDQLLRSTCGAG